jgi:peptidoglycan/LPS O-acetylase OafA/YrhL
MALGRTTSQTAWRKSPAMPATIVPILVTLLFVGLLVVVANISYYLIEQPGQKLFARLARSRIAPSPVRSVGVV